MKQNRLPSNYLVHKGFTIIELMVVIGIMTIGIGAGIVGFQQSSNLNRLNGAADRTKQLFSQAKANAQSGKKDCERCNRNPLILDGLKKCGTGDDPLQGWTVGVTPAPPLPAVGPATTPAIVVIRGICGPTPYPNADPNRQNFYETRVELPLNIQVETSPMPTPLLFRPAGGGVVPQISQTIRIFDMTTPLLQKCFVLSDSGSITWKTGTCP